VHKVTVNLKKLKKREPDEHVIRLSFTKRMTTGRHSHPVQIWKKYKSDEHVIRLLFSKQNENRMKLIWLSCCQIGKISRSPSTISKTPN